MTAHLIIDHALSLFARGGGGGSGGGGGGGGGGGSGGGGAGGGIIVIALAGYAPTHYAGKLLRRHVSNIVGLTLMIIITLVVASFFFFIFGGIWLLAGIGALVGGPAGYFSWWSKAGSVLSGSRKAKQVITTAATLDPAWDAAALDARVRSVFMQYQADWSNYNVESMKHYLTPGNWQYNNLMLVALQQRQRRNLVEQPVIETTTVMEAIDAQDNSYDSVTFYVQANAKDKLVDTLTNTVLYTDTSTFEEYWRFTRTGDVWMLDHIEQATADVLSLDSKVRKLAADNGYFYSIDWGWLLIPNRGELFKAGKFGTSDINNHVIGVYKNVLIELYSYVPKPGSNQKTYTIAQAGLPKRYDSLIVRPKGNFLTDRTPKGYNKLSLEWPDFNRRYTVYATNVEQVTAFELLHPVYMEKLFALNFKVGIEVVDNVVYLYSKDKNADYATMLALLKDAFEEMKL